LRLDHGILLVLLLGKLARSLGKVLLMDARDLAARMAYPVIPLDDDQPAPITVVVSTSATGNPRCFAMHAESLVLNGGGKAGDDGRRASPLGNNPSRKGRATPWVWRSDVSGSDSESNGVPSEYPLKVSSVYGSRSRPRSLVTTQP